MFSLQHDIYTAMSEVQSRINVSAIRYENGFSYCTMPLGIKYKKRTKISALSKKDITFTPFNRIAHCMHICVCMFCILNGWKTYHKSFCKYFFSGVIACRIHLYT